MSRRTILAVLALVLSVIPAGFAPAQEADDELTQRIDELIRELGDEDYFVRERAQAELAKVGFEAFDALEIAEQSDDIEIARRAKYLLRRMQVDWVQEGDPPAVRDLLTDYERHGEFDRLRRIRELVRLLDDAGLPALCRLVRFERSPVLSKQAALELIQYRDPRQVDWDRRGRLIADNLRRSPRPGAEWLKAYRGSHNDPGAAVETWGRLIQAEEETLSQTPEQSQVEFVSALVRHQADLLRDLDRREEAVEAMRKLVALERGDPRSLAELVDWLSRREAWPVIDELAERFSSPFETHALLLYTLAQARQSQGQTDQVEEIVARARAIEPADGEAHRRVARALARRGWFAWAEEEYRHVMELAPTGSDGLWAQAMLAEMLHDRGDELAAATLREALAATLDRNIERGEEEQNANMEPASVRARMHYCYANHYAATGDRAKQIEHLEAGIREDPFDGDVLIALYRLGDRKPEERHRTLELINQAVEHFRTEIEEDPESSLDAYNQLAWLVGNTEGDQDEALRASQKSIEIIDTYLEGLPQDESRSADVDRALDARPGFVDTLARCYYAQGDYENAVRLQSQAVEEEPHSGQMGRQLALFREALAKSKM